MATDQALLSLSREYHDARAALLSGSATPETSARHRDATLAYARWLAGDASATRGDNSLACVLLDALLRDPNARDSASECLRWSAVARMRLGEFREARLACEELMRRDPDDATARALHAEIRAKVRSDGVRGMVVVVLVAVGAAVLGSAFRTWRSAAH